MIDRSVMLFSGRVFCSPGVFTEYDDCVLLSEQFAACFLEDADGAGGDGSSYDTGGE